VKTCASFRPLTTTKREREREMERGNESFKNQSDKKSGHRWLKRLNFFFFTKVHFAGVIGNTR
jgi:hypothetical protein